MKITKAWHFTDGNHLRDGRPIPPPGTWLIHKGPVRICESGLHASKRIIDALRFSPGSQIHRVECRNVIDQDHDKFVASERRIVWSVKGETLLKVFARKCALDVIHLWNAPMIVKRYLKTGDDDLRAASEAASKAASCAASEAAFYAASKAASWAASCAALEAASKAASWAASWAASEAASWAASEAASEAASWAASKAAQNRRLTSMVIAAHRKDP